MEEVRIRPVETIFKHELATEVIVRKSQQWSMYASVSALLVVVDVVITDHAVLGCVQSHAIFLAGYVGSAQ